MKDQRFPIPMDLNLRMERYASFTIGIAITDAEILMARFREEDVAAGKILSRDGKLRILVNKSNRQEAIRMNLCEASMTDIGDL